MRRTPAADDVPAGYGRTRTVERTDTTPGGPALTTTAPRPTGVRGPWMPRLWAVGGVSSIGLLLVVGLLGPSAAVVPLAPGPQQLADPWLVTALTVLAALTGSGAVAAGLAAQRAGWRPDPRALLAAGALATVALLAVPPLGNGDIGSYAAYGRTAALGLSPYTTVPSALPDDPVVSAAEPPWQDQVSVYGPVATGVHLLAARVGGDSREAVLRLLALSSAAAFLAVGALLGRRARDPGRAHLLWTTNPLLLLHLVAGAHVDVLLCLALLLAVTARPGPPGAGRAVRTGLALGAAVCVKVTAGLSVAALLLARRRRAVLPVVVAGVMSTGLYLLAGGVTALEPVLAVRSRVSAGTPWRWVASGLEQVLPDSAARSLVGLGVLALVLVLARALHRDLPAAEPFLRACAVLWLAYLLAAGYQLAWYDAAGFVLLALLAASRFDALLLVHTAVLTVAYLPGRLVPLPDALADLLLVVRSGITPVVVLVLWVLAVRPPRTPRAPRTASPPTHRR